LRGGGGGRKKRTDDPFFFGKKAPGEGGGEIKKKSVLSLGEGKREKGGCPHPLIRVDLLSFRNCFPGGEIYLFPGKKGREGEIPLGREEEEELNDFRSFEKRKKRRKIFPSSYRGGRPGPDLGRRRRKRSRSGSGEEKGSSGENKKKQSQALVFRIWEGEKGGEKAENRFDKNKTRGRVEWFSQGGGA